MTHTKNAIIIAVVTLALVGAAIVIFGQAVANAAIANFSPNNCYTAAATSTLGYMTPGTGTTTATCNLGFEGARSAAVAVEVNASSSITTYQFYTEESMNNQDWFPVTPNVVASTTNPTFLTAKGYVQLQFSSSTIGATGLGSSLNGTGVDGTNNRNHYLFEVPVHMRYVRVNAALASSTIPSIQNGAVWMQIIPRQDIN